MKVSDLMKTEVVTCKDTDAVGAVAKLMWEHDIGFVPVISAENGSLVGVVTDRDGFIAAYFQGKSLWEIPVKSAMTTRLATCLPDADFADAERLMRDFQVRRLPVVTKDGRLAGIVSLNDLARKAAGEADEKFEEEVAVTLGAIAQPREIRPQA